MYTDYKDIIQCFSSYTWRQDNLFFIKDKSGHVVQYRPNGVQSVIISDPHRRKIIPKARQHGVTTGVALHFLNVCLGIPHQRCAIIAHRESDSLKIFDQKIRFPLEHIPEIYRPFLPQIKKLTNCYLELDNGSTISADTMVRSDTLTHLHISELGKMCAWYPIKAQEVQTGALPAAERGEIIIESTMEGASGLMYDICLTALQLQHSGAELTERDYKLLFFGWYLNAEYSSGDCVEPTDADKEYFVSLAGDHGISLTTEQKNWYLKEREILKDKMKQEYPATFEESVAESLEGTFFSREYTSMVTSKRICKVPYDVHCPVYAALDLGFNDATAITVFQVVWKEIRIIEYHECSKTDIGVYASWLGTLPYGIHTVFLPHDGGSKSLQTGRSIDDILRQDHGFKTKVLDRDKHEYIQIDRAKRYFDRVWVDSHCERLLECMRTFSREYNKRFNTWLSTSRHDEYSDGMKSFLYMMQAIEYLYDNQNNEDFTASDLARMRSRHIYRGPK